MNETSQKLFKIMSKDDYVKSFSRVLLSIGDISRILNKLYYINLPWVAVAWL